jgi:hypothetical protein
VFFTSPAALTPHAMNDVPVGSQGHLAQNLYEWRDGHVSLISDGRDTSATSSFSSVRLYGTDATGDNVFFRTGSRLVPQDTDTSPDYYDARVGGGIPYTPPPEPCADATCHGLPAAASSAPTAASVTFSGPGNATPASKAAASKAAVAVTKRTVHGNAFTLTVKVPAAGRISAGGRNVRSANRSVTKRGSYALAVRLTAKATRTLKKRHKLKAVVRIGFTPTQGSTSSTTVTITVKA